MSNDSSPKFASDHEEYVANLITAASVKNPGTTFNFSPTDKITVNNPQILELQWRTFSLTEFRSYFNV